MIVTLVISDVSMVAWNIWSNAKEWKKVLVFISDFKATWSEYIFCNIKQPLATIQFIDKELDKIRGVDKGGGKNKWYLQNL